MGECRFPYIHFLLGRTPAEACRGQVQEPAEGLPCPAVPALVTGARVGVSHSSGQSFFETNGRDRRVSSAQSMPKCRNAPTRYHMSRLTALSHPTGRRKNGAQPPPWSELNLCSPCETGIDRQRKDSRVQKLLLRTLRTVRKRLKMTTENSATHLALCSPVQGAQMENLHKRWHSCAGEMTCSSLCAVRPMRVGETGKRGAQAKSPASFGKSAAATATSYTGPIPPRIKALRPRAVQKPFPFS
jgi:hypothetical protein